VNSALFWKLSPRVYFEIGLGHSIKFARHAIKLGGLQTKVISIDPDPRAEIDNALRLRSFGCHAKIPAIKSSRSYRLVIFFFRRIAIRSDRTMMQSVSTKRGKWPKLLGMKALISNPHFSYIDIAWRKSTAS